MSKQIITEKLFNDLNEYLIRYDNSYNHSRIVKAIVEAFEENGWVNSSDPQGIPDEVVEAFINSFRWKIEVNALAEWEKDNNPEQFRDCLEHKKSIGEPPF